MWAIKHAFSATSKAGVDRDDADNDFEAWKVAFAAAARAGDLL
jgi:hypothetical protein